MPDPDYPQHHIYQYRQALLLLRSRAAVGSSPEPLSRRPTSFLTLHHTEHRRSSLLLQVWPGYGFLLVAAELCFCWIGCGRVCQLSLEMEDCGDSDLGG